ncbi:MAG: 1-deoxy-D-xylulose-5-phosphate reductoisomerase [Campylobacteraceae bacterium]|jgi:1-deoxy-D-xylulose-5-phosphate reductoisomerase|nr:1-deoxy-D-xylulose-5-phosphate reductoisomerase [Campylobacteraceae bacterium]
MYSSTWGISLRGKLYSAIAASLSLTESSLYFIAVPPTLARLSDLSRERPEGGLLLKGSATRRYQSIAVRCILRRPLPNRVPRKRVLPASPECVRGWRGLRSKEDEVLVNALVGFAGLAPTIKASALGYKIALANKESLVAAGKFLSTSNIVPIDSEHFGLWYLLGQKEPKRLLITASGGALRDIPLSKIADVTLKDTLNHPNWKMGKKITIDSATMINKLFEILEAHWLFGCKEIDAFMETKSVIHALIEFLDGSTTAHLANADMRLPIAFALLNEIKEPIIQNINLLQVKNLEFREIDVLRYPAWQLREFLLKNPHLGVVLNAANDEAVRLFLEEKIAFSNISKCVINAVEKFEHIKVDSIDEVFLANSEVKLFCSKVLKADRL